MKIKNRNFIYGLTFLQHVFCSNCAVWCAHTAYGSTFFLLLLALSFGKANTSIFCRPYIIGPCLGRYLTFGVKN